VSSAERFLACRHVGCPSPALGDYARWARVPIVTQPLVIR
jgi:hypothetical protein